MMRVNLRRSLNCPALHCPYPYGGDKSPASQAAVRVKGLITGARSTEPRVQGSKCQLILILSLLFSRLHAFLPAELLPVPLGSSWGCISAAARITHRVQPPPA